MCNVYTHTMIWKLWLHSYAMWRNPLMQVLSACVYTLGHYAYFYYYISNVKKKRAAQKTHSNGKPPVNLRFVRRDSITELEDDFPFESLMDFLPAVIEDQVCLQLYFLYLCELLNYESNFTFIVKYDILLYHCYCLHTLTLYILPKFLQNWTYLSTANYLCMFM